MKRIISLFLVASVLLFSFAIPSYAQEPVLIDLLDYYSVNENGTNIFWAENLVFVTFPEASGLYHYVDLVIRFEEPQTSKIPIIFYHSEGDLWVYPTYIDAYTQRWVAQLKGDYTGDFSFRLRNYVNPSYAEVLSCRVSSQQITSFDCPLTGTVVYGGGDEVNFYYNNWDDYTGVNVSGSSNLNYDKYTSYILIDDWLKFDYIDLQFYLSELSLNSLTVTVDGLSIPFTVNYLNSSSSSAIVAADILLDLTAIRRDLDGPLELCITGNVPILDGRVGRFVVMHSFGFVKETLLNSDAIFFHKLKSFLTNSFNSISTWITNQTSTLTNSISSSFSNLNSWITNQTSTLTNSISTSFSNLNSWILNQTSTLSNSISTWGQNIIDALTPDTNDAEDVIDQADQQAGELQQGNDVLNNVPKPDLTGAGDISSIISPSNVTSNTLFLTNLMSGPILSDVLLLSLIFSLAGFVLFGKR